EDIEQLTQLMDAVLPPHGGPHVSLVDTRRLTHVDPGAFSVMARYFEERRAAFSSVIRRQALVRPVGLAGAVVAGFYQVIAPSFPVSIFESLDEALSWLAPHGSQALQLALNELHGCAREKEPLLDAVRSLLERTHARLSLSAAARELGMSQRTLQRRLCAVDTTFQDELLQARVRAGQALMLASEDNLTAIALEVGCASLQHYSALFRRLTGVSPSTWRKRFSPSEPLHSASSAPSKHGPESTKRSSFGTRPRYSRAASVSNDPPSVRGSAPSSSRVISASPLGSVEA
ncbi:MAG TPA: helix-turn-helix domain-containing protein, partial [Polyangiaceae bacterium]|nr:helix-turn-helix domain-containing protein [Polyangiaceae bacterium]